MSYTTQVVVYERNGWKLTSYGRGAAYLLECGGKRVFLQGDDADIFRGEVMEDDGFLRDSCEERFADYSGVMEG